MSLLRNLGRRAAAEKASDPRLHDPATQLPGPLLFQDRLERALARSVRRREACAVLVIVLDRDPGEALLREVAARLDTCLRPEDTLARMDGRQFAVLLESVAPDAEDEAIAVAGRITQALGASDADRPALGASVGIAIGRGGRERPEDVLQNAEIAVERAIRSSSSRHELFRHEGASHPATRLGLEADLRRALERDELFVEYQPEVDLASRRVLAVEALLRWHHPERGVIEPAEFVPVAEETGLILPFGKRLLREAAAEAASWPEEIRLSVNFAARQLQQPALRLMDELSSALAAAGLEPERLRVEITESAVMRDPEAAREVMGRLERQGVRLAVDDFGAGYSSLANLRSFPLELVKIDRQLVAELDSGDEAGPIVGALVDMCHALRAEVLGEGIETEEQVARLLELGCDRGQGHLFSPPVSAEEIGRLVAVPS
jgi:diguanylate cyclase (GGDEF)-like protein